MIRPLRARHRRLVLASFLVALGLLLWGLTARGRSPLTVAPAELRAVEATP